MTLASGTQLGPYEILAAIGAGGMGEVYKAKDTRLDRFVAIKVLPEDVAKNPDSLARFEREAKAVAALNHPNIVGIHDFAVHEATPYVVMELLEGGSMSQRLLQGPFTPRKAIELAVQMAHGLAAAHDKGVIHRDLKPDNLWITTEGRLKILDFGLAKQTALRISGSGSDQETIPLPKGHATREGVILGTVGYMSPEQVRGEPVDARSDIFAFGLVLWEMIAGHRPFEGSSAVEILHGILRDDAPSFPESLNVPPLVEHLISHCIEKLPDARFQSAKDLAYNLQSVLSAPSGPLSGSLPGTVGAFPKAKASEALWWTAAGLVPLVALLSFAFGRHQGTKPPEPPGFQALLKRPEPYTSAVVAPGGRSILFTQLKPDGSRELMAQDLDVPRPRAMGIDGYDILGVSAKGELALLRHSTVTQPWGMLALAPAGGGAPRDVLDNVYAMAWHPDGARQALVVNHPELAAQVIEFPAGKEIYRLPYGFGLEPRLAFSPDGNVLAFIGGVAGSSELHLLTPTNGSCRTFPIPDLLDCLWTKAGLFVIQSTRDQEALVDRVDLRTGSLETLARLPLPLEFLAAFPDGDLLVGTGTTQVQLSWEGAGIPLRLMDAQGLKIEDMDGPGNRLIYSSRGQEIWLADRQTKEPTLLGKGDLPGLSPDGDAVVARLALGEKQFGLTLIPLGQGRPVQIPGSFEHPFAHLLPGGKQLLIASRTPSGENQLRTMTLEGKVEKQFGAFRGREKPSPDGRLAIVFRTEADAIKTYLLPLQGGELQPLDFQSNSSRVLGWLKDSSGFYWGSNSPQIPYEVHVRDLKSGKDQLWKALKADSPKGILGIKDVRVSADGKTFAYMVMERSPALLFKLKVAKP